MAGSVEREASTDRDLWRRSRVRGRMVGCAPKSCQHPTDWGYFIMHAFLISTGIVALAEIGDKTQLRLAAGGEVPQTPADRRRHSGGDRAQSRRRRPGRSLGGKPDRRVEQAPTSFAGGLALVSLAMAL